MGENINFERIVPDDGIHDDIEFNAYEGKDSNVTALVIIVGSLVVTLIGIVGMLLIL